MSNDSLSPVQHACFGPSGTKPELVPLADDVAQLLIDLSAPPRLAAHLRAVHDVARQIVDGVSGAFPEVTIDSGAVSYGAATHDIGKVLHPHELTGRGAEHEQAGEGLLLEHGVRGDRARFARTHASWSSNDVSLEDLLVTLADKIWKGRREEDLEQLIVQHLAAATGGEPWEIFMRLDDVLSRIAEGADERLAFQNQFAAT